MSENQNCGINAFAKYDAMTTEELEEILRLDAEMPEGQESDTDKILYIMEVLAERKRNNCHTGKTALEAFESFKQNYMPETENRQSTVPAKTKHGFPRWARGLVATAAVLAILLTCSITAKAYGFNVWKAIVQWTQETFHFGEWGNTDVNSNLQFHSLQEALEEGNTPSWLVPTLIPEGFDLADITVKQTPQKKTYKAIYINEKQTLVITVQDHLNKIPVYVEQSEELAEEYEASGIVYHIFTDVDLAKAKWISESYECSISGDITIEELKMMIDSIEKG